MIAVIKRYTFGVRFEPPRGVHIEMSTKRFTGRPARHVPCGRGGGGSGPFTFPPPMWLGGGGGIGNAPARTPVCSHTVGWQHRVGWDVGVWVGLGTMIDMSWSGCHSIVT